MKHFQLSVRCFGRGWKGMAYGLFLLLSYPSGYAQSFPTNPASWGRFTLKASIGNQTIGFPFQNLWRAYNPVLSNLGFDYRVNKGQKHLWSIGLASSFVQNEVTGNAWMISGRVQYRYTHVSGVLGEAGLSLGSLLQAYPREQIAIWSATDREGSPPRWTSGSYSGVDLGLGYDFGPRFQKRYALLLQYAFGIQSPYFPSTAFPILPHNILSLGIQVRLNAFTPNVSQS